MAPEVATTTTNDQSQKSSAQKPYSLLQHHKKSYLIPTHFLLNSSHVAYYPRTQTKLKTCLKRPKKNETTFQQVQTISTLQCCLGFKQCCLFSCGARGRLGGRVRALAAGRVLGRDARGVLFEEHACGLSRGQTALRVHDPPAPAL